MVRVQALVRVTEMCSRHLTLTVTMGMNGFQTNTSIPSKWKYIVKRFLVLHGVKTLDTCKGHPDGQLGSNMDLSSLGAWEIVIFILDDKCSLCTCNLHVLVLGVVVP